MKRITFLIKVVFSTVILMRLASSIFAKEIPIGINADSIEYGIDADYITAWGNVRITQDKVEITADYVELHIKEKKIFAEGSVSIKRENVKLEFSSGTYITEDETSESYEVYGTMPPWIFKARKMSSGKNRHICIHSHITTCELEKPHYKVKATKMMIVPEKIMTVNNAVFYIGDVPVFYLPYWWQSLGESRLNLKAEPGHNSTDGLTLRTILSYQYSDFLEAKLLVDYFSKRGVGKGMETNYRVPTKMKSTLYLYHIKEETTSAERWRARGYLWRQISNFWSVQSELNFMSDENFNQSYFRESWNFIEREIKTNLFFTRHTNSGILRLGASKREIFDISKNKYIQTRAVIPSVEYIGYKRHRYIGFYPEFSGYLKRSSTGYQESFLYDIQSKISISRQERIFRNLTLSPNIGFAGNLTEIKKDDFNFIGRYYIGSGARYSPLRIIDFDFTYSYRQKTSPNEMKADPSGVENNLLNIQMFAGLKSGMYWKTSGGYDFLLKNELPLINELNLIYKKNTLYLRHRQGLKPYKYLNSQISYSHSDIFSLNVSHNSDSPDIMGIGGSLRVSVGGKTSLEYSIAGNLKKSMYNPLSQQVILKRDLHCWEGQLTYRTRVGFEEFLLSLNLKTATFTTPLKKDTDNEFYPWK